MRRRGFTLIELLVVVGVIAILAAIAVPNFLEAQTRSKVTRVLADLNTLQKGVEAYAVDHNAYPRMTWGEAPYFDLYEGNGSPLQPIYGTLGAWVTTPVAYVSAFDLLDPFGDDINIQADARMYTYHSLLTGKKMLELSGHTPYTDPYVGDFFEKNFGQYWQMSIGPDKTLGDIFTQYDPTNGTRSAGNVFVSQRTRERVPVRQ